MTQRNLFSNTPEPDRVVIVTGSRNASTDYDYHKISDILAKEYAKAPFKLVHGNARGADSQADRWARERGVEVRAFPAQWDLYGKAAGMRRNRDMLTQYPQAKVIAFPIGESRGTRGCVAEARKRGMIVEVYEG